MKNQEQIYDALVLLSVILGYPQDSKRLQFYAEALKDYDLSRVLVQIKSFSTKAKYFPQLVEIIEPLAGLDVPVDEMAVIIASEIVECLHKFGNTQIDELKKHLGDKYQIVERSGGWQALSMVEYSELPATRAQLRELAKAYISRSKREATNSRADFILDASVKNITQKNTGLKLLKIE